eukprot:13023880-Alexandrium_andersonii.AAC.1
MLGARARRASRYTVTSDQNLHADSERAKRCLGVRSQTATRGQRESWGRRAPPKRSAGNCSKLPAGQHRKLLEYALN